LDTKTFISVVVNLPSHIAVLSKGETGIGKSDIFKQISDMLSLPIIDRRLSQMQEGDLIGLPELVDGVTRFAPPDWYMRACREPVVVFLDELNRAVPELQQCAFQIILDRELNGHKLHPETRVFSAVNEGDDFQVNEMDPALLRRFFVADLEPTTEDWLAWARKTNIDEVITSFIKKYPVHLKHEGQRQPGTVYPYPASWHRLDQSFKHAKIEPKDYAGTTVPEMMYSMSSGFIGETTAIAFIDFVKNYVTRYNAEDVLNSFEKNKKGLTELKDDKRNDILSQVITFCESNDLILVQAENLDKFLDICGDEPMVNFINSLMATKHRENIKLVHKFVGQKVVKAVSATMKLA
jgi:hypothetical protein